MALKAVLFDLDGTLLDTAPDFKTALNLLLAEEGKGPLTEDQVKVMVSHGSADLIANAFHMEATHPDFEPLRARLLAFYIDHLSENTAFFEGLQPGLEYIRAQGWGYGIVTNKPALYAEKIVADLKIDADCLICPDHVAKPKPDPEGLLLACEQIGCNADEAIYVGDHVRDVDAAKAINMPTVAAAWGYIPVGESVEDWQADYLLQKPDELLALLQTFADNSDD